MLALLGGVLLPCTLLVLALQTTGSIDEAVGDLETEIATGHRRGKAVRLALVWVQGDVWLEIEAALVFSWMATEAEEEGVQLRVRSGFRTFQEQRWLWRCFQTCSCNGCRRAAPPGYSSHETGRAVDLDVRNRRVRSWLRRHAERFGFVGTVKSEPWHFEYFER